MPMPQKMEKASTKFSSFWVKGKLLNLLTNCETKKKEIKIMNVGIKLFINLQRIEFIT